MPPRTAGSPLDDFRANTEDAILYCVLGPGLVLPHLIKVVLAAIALTGESYQYPPVNWASVLSPLMRLDFGKILF